MFKPAQVIEKVQESQTIWSFYLKPADGSPIAHYLPGQHIIVRLQIPGRENPVQRSYTLSGAPGQDHYRITVKREGSVSAPIISLTQSGQSFSWADGYGNLLNLLEKHDIYPPSSCREGTCMSCSTRIISGTVTYDPEPFGDPFEGEILLCCARPETDIALDL